MAQAGVRDIFLPYNILGGAKLERLVRLARRVEISVTADSEVTVKGLSHITGGGISDNLPRVLPENLHATVDTSTWQQGAIFDWLAEHGNISDVEMRRTFNCGIGMIVVVSDTECDSALSTLAGLGEKAWHIGQVVADAGQVQYL